MVVDITHGSIGSFSRHLIDNSIDTSVNHGECLSSVGDGRWWIGDDGTGCIMIQLWDGVGMSVFGVGSGDTVGWRLPICCTTGRSSSGGGVTGPVDV